MPFEWQIAKEDISNIYQNAINQLYQQRGPHQSSDMILQQKRQEGYKYFKVTQFRHWVSMFYFFHKSSSPLSPSYFQAVEVDLRLLPQKCSDSYLQFAQPPPRRRNWSTNPWTTPTNRDEMICTNTHYKSQKTQCYELTIRKIHKSCWKADRRLQMVEAPQGELVLHHDVLTYLVMTILIFGTYRVIQKEWKK